MNDENWNQQVWRTFPHPDQPGMFIGYAETRGGTRIVITGESRDHLQHHLIEMQLSNQDDGEAMFLKAWKRGVKFFPGFFHCTAPSVDEATSKNQLRPNWDAVEMALARRRLDPWERNLLMALCSFFNDEWMAEWAKKQRLHAWHPGTMAARLDMPHREVIADLLVSYRGW